MGVSPMKYFVSSRAGRACHLERRRMRLRWLFQRRQIPAETPPAQEVSVDEAEEQRYKPVEWPIVRRVIQNLMPYRRMYLGGLLLGMVMLILEMQSPRFMQ